MIRPLLTISFAILLLAACSTDPARVNEIFAVADPGVEQAEDFHMIFSDSGRIRARIAGPLLLHYLDPANQRDEFPKGVEVEFYGASGSVQSWLSARYALRLAREQKVLLRDSVVMENYKGERLQTAELIWDELAGLVKTDKFAKITRVDGTIIYCYGFVSNEQFTDYTLLSIEGPVNIESLKDPSE